MKIMSIIFSFLLLSLGSLTASASSNSEQIKLAVEKLSSCGNFISADQTYVYTGFGSYNTGSPNQRLARPSFVRMIDIQNLREYQVATLDSAVALVSYNNLTYILTYSGLEEWDMQTRQRKAVYATQSNDQVLADEQHPRGMALYKDKLVIAQGRLGVSFFNLLTKTPSKTLPLIFQGELESTAQDVAVSGRNAYVVLDNYTLVEKHEKPAFRGVVVVDMENENVSKVVGDLPPGLSNINADQKFLITSFYGNPIWKFSIPSILTSSKSVKPTLRLFKFPKEGSPTGKAFMDDKYYYTCFWEAPAQRGFFTRGKIVLNRNQMMLD